MRGTHDALADNSMRAGWFAPVMVRWWKWAAVLLLAVLAVGALDWWRDRPSALPGQTPLNPAALRPGYGPKTYPQALAAADDRVSGWRARMAARPDDWSHKEGLASALAARSRLTGSYSDLVEADRLLDAAMTGLPWPAGPVRSRASLSLTLHRLDEAEAALDRFDAWAAPMPDERDDALQMRCEIALQRGNPMQARDICADSKSLAARLREANIAAKTGQYAQAERLLETEMRQTRHSPHTLAVLALQRAAIGLESGDWSTARRWIEAADAVFPGFWLTQAYAAQQAVLDDRFDKAEHLYAALADASDAPEVFDAYARVLEAQGRGRAAAEWTERARQGWEERSRLLPEAAAAHRVEHLLGSRDRDAALELARTEYRRRPTSASALNYAAALTGTGDFEAALAVLRETQARGWRSAALLHAEWQALLALGRSDEAERALGEAKSLNPRIDDRRQAFISFHQH